MPTRARTERERKVPAKQAELNGRAVEEAARELLAATGRRRQWGTLTPFEREGVRIVTRRVIRAYLAEAPQLSQRAN